MTRLLKILLLIALVLFLIPFFAAVGLWILLLILE